MPHLETSLRLFSSASNVSKQCQSNNLIFDFSFEIGFLAVGEEQSIKTFNIGYWYLREQYDQLNAVVSQVRNVVSN